MAVINIPPDPSGPGRSSALINVNKAEAQSIIALLQQAKDLLESDGLPVQKQQLPRGARQVSSSQPERSRQLQAAQPEQRSADEENSASEASGQAQGQSNPPVPAKAQQLFPENKSRSDTSSTSGEPQRKTQQAAVSAEQAEQRLPQQAQATPRERYEQQPERAASARADEPAAWAPSTQSPQQQPEQSYQQDSRMSYGQTAGQQDKWIGSSGKRAGKQLLASKGTRGPVTLNYMSWDEPGSSSSPAEEEPAATPQPGRGRPRQSKLGQRPIPKAQQRQLSPQSSSEAPPASLLQPSTAFPQPDSIPPHLPAAQAAYPASLPAHPAAAPSHAPAAPQPNYPPTNAGQPRHNVQLHTSVSWQRVWTTDAADHNGDMVPACLHLASMTDLPDNGEHAGYLVSASNGVLNLWQCSCSFDEPALQLVHCLETEFDIADLQLDPASNLLLAAAKDMRATTECVAVHHLRMTPGIFRLNGRLGLPVGATGQRAKNSGAPVAMQVQSVHHYQGTLTGCCAASCGGQIAIYPSKVVHGELAKAKGSWTAHSNVITALHAGGFQPHLLSGDQAGYIHGWNLRTKPSEPVYKMKHKSAVTGLVTLSDLTFLSCSTDSRIAIWDIRNNSRPVHSMATPDGSPILKISVQSGNKQMAFSTTSGVYAVDLDKFGKVQCVATADTAQTSSLGLAWNTGTGGQSYLYAASGAEISAYRPFQ